ncbi:hypothetical protein NBH00_06005 [Paraconexibacter antarcticus]|uniref:Uncharacterized protein n=1 Tax=Paraconexibacter antarcticus TaxID=2949664 RepID=A0ABY5DUT4_9ACTN|nr:hypothetical protein [Paraconexibacter antarcticus]UTI65765.1 hypothetical protein NBH00_06005 [Paraconexibacter antarcticus]
MHVSDDEVLEVDGVVEDGDLAPVVAEPVAREVTSARPALPVIAQAAAVAATGFAAGAVAAAVVRAARAHRPVKARRRAAALGPHVVATRSFIVDVHILAPRD